MEKFIDREQAGKLLANQLKEYAQKKDVIALALPRGGVPVAFEVARALSIPLDIFIVRKLGLPGNKELAMGALASGGTVVFDYELINNLDVPQMTIDETVMAEKKELLRRESLYRSNKIFPDIQGKTIFLIDDGIATGLTMRAAILALRQKNPAMIIITVPVAPLAVCKKMARIADKLICLLKPENFYSVGLWYEHFEQVSDEEVSRLLENL